MEDTPIYPRLLTKEDIRTMIFALHDTVPLQNDNRAHIIAELDRVLQEGFDMFEIVPNYIRAVQRYNNRED